MKARKYAEEQIIAVLKEGDAGESRTLPETMLPF